MMKNSNGKEAAQKIDKIKRDKELQEFIKKEDRRDLAMAFLCTTPFLLILFTVSFIIGKNLAHEINIWNYMFFSFLILCLVGFVCRQKLYGRAVYGGMENAPAIAFGAFFIFLGGSLAGLHQSVPFWYPLRIIITSASSVLIGTFLSFISFKEGPTHGWGSYIRKFHIE